MEIKPINSFNKILKVAGDKSITHRAIMFNALSEGKAVISKGLLGEDCLSTIDCMRKLGADIELSGDKITVEGKPLAGASLNVGNSGTTMRLLSGALCGQNINVVLDGDNSIRSRPMKRVIEPLGLMGAKFDSSNGYAPLSIYGSPLNGIEYNMPIASAQVKSAILLAGLCAEGKTTVIEKVKSRDHTELMLKAMGADIAIDGLNVTIKKSKLVGKNVIVPADISSAAYPLILACCLKGSILNAINVGINPTRTGIIDVLKACGAKIYFDNVKDNIEKAADISLKYTALKPFVIEGDIVPRLIDEIPILAVLGCFIEGTSIIRGAEELKVKESNRIDTTVSALKAMGADITATNDGMIINGKGYLEGGAVIETKRDHRIAMALAVAGACSKKGVKLINHECAYISYPNFYELFK